ncbi:MAG: hypothetical protein QGH20_07890 [Candidatus Latescibacteria bacterium]|nr:hypothetical protein [Candidatus Latescibacterota bacterium]
MARLVEQGRLIIGPQYIIPDGYAPTGETFVRNLLIGLERCEEMGHAPDVLYHAEPSALDG